MIGDIAADAVLGLVSTDQAAGRKTDVVGYYGELDGACGHGYEARNIMNMELWWSSLKSQNLAESLPKK